VVTRVGLVGAGRADWQVVVESSDGAGVVGQHSLGSQEWVEGLNWSALQRERSPLDGDERPQRFPLDRPGAVVDSAVRDWLDRLDRLDWLYGLYDWLGVVSMLSCWLRMVGLGSLCGVLGMVGSMGSMFSMMGSMGGRFSMMGSMSGSFSMLLAMVGVVVVVVMIVTISRDQGEDH